MTSEKAPTQCWMASLSRSNQVSPLEQASIMVITSVSDVEDKSDTLFQQTFVAVPPR